MLLVQFVYTLPLHVAALAGAPWQEVQRVFQCAREVNDMTRDLYSDCTETTNNDKNIDQHGDRDSPRMELP